jgi:hypothetical protein
MEEFMETHRIACMRCVHYQATFDPKAPRGCKLYNFKSFSMPSVLVKQSTGQDCQSFEEKVKHKEEEEKINLNDPKYWGE